MYKRKLLWLFGALLISACGGDETSYSTSDIDSASPAGDIGGARWEMVEAVVQLEGSSMDIELFAEDVEDCNTFASSEAPSVMFSVQSEVGEYPLSFSFSGGQTVTLYDPADNNNIIATEGVIHVVDVTDTEVTVGLIADAGDSSLINGTFTASICPSGS